MQGVSKRNIDSVVFVILSLRGSRFMWKHYKTVVSKNTLQSTMTFTKCDVDILKLLRFDQLRYVMLLYVGFT